MVSKNEFLLIRVKVRTYSKGKSSNSNFQTMVVWKIELGRKEVNNKI
jgi:hypothetical protein